MYALRLIRQQNPTTYTTPYTLADPVSMEMLNSAPYIVEGKLIDGETFCNKDTSRYICSVSVQISKVYKGNLKEGSVELISDGGEVGIIEIDGNNGPALNSLATYVFYSKTLK